MLPTWQRVDSACLYWRHPLHPAGWAHSANSIPVFHASVAHSVSHFSQKIASDLKLAAHGYDGASRTLPTIGLSSDQDHVVIQDGSLSGTGAVDSDAYQKYNKLMRRFADALKPFWLKTMPRIGNNSVAELMTFAHVGLNMRRMGKKDMREFLRIISLPARDLMDENFESDVLKAMLSWDGLIGSKLAPRSPNGAVLAMLYRMAGESSGAHVIPKGGVNGLVTSLSTAATASGADIRNGAKVGRILIEGSVDGLVAKGVRLVDGEKIAANNVISAADPKKTFLDLVGVEHLEIGFTNRIRRLRCDGLCRETSSCAKRLTRV